VTRVKRVDDIETRRHNALKAIADAVRASSEGSDGWDRREEPRLVRFVWECAMKEVFPALNGDDAMLRTAVDPMAFLASSNEAARAASDALFRQPGSDRIQVLSHQEALDEWRIDVTPVLVEYIGRYNRWPKKMLFALSHILCGLIDPSKDAIEQITHILQDSRWPGDLLCYNNIAGKLAEQIRVIRDASTIFEAYQGIYGEEV
jgi:hypothetical protein